MNLARFLNAKNGLRAVDLLQDDRQEIGVAKWGAEAGKVLAAVRRASRASGSSHPLGMPGLPGRFRYDKLNGQRSYAEIESDAQLLSRSILKPWRSGRSLHKTRSV